MADAKDASLIEDRFLVGSGEALLAREGRVGGPGESTDHRSEG